MVSEFPLSAPPCFCNAPQHFPFPLLGILLRKSFPFSRGLWVPTPWRHCPNSCPAGRGGCCIHLPAMMGTLAQNHGFSPSGRLVLCCHLGALSVQCPSTLSIVPKAFLPVKLEATLNLALLEETTSLPCIFCCRHHLIRQH